MVGAFTTITGVVDTGSEVYPAISPNGKVLLFWRTDPIAGDNDEAAPAIAGANLFFSRAAGGYSALFRASETSGSVGDATPVPGLMTPSNTSDSEPFSSRMAACSSSPATRPDAESTEWTVFPLPELGGVSGVSGPWIAKDGCSIAVTATSRTTSFQRDLAGATRISP